MDDFIKSKKRDEIIVSFSIYYSIFQVSFAQFAQHLFDSLVIQIHLIQGSEISQNIDEQLNKIVC